ncbi:hypothetical protein MGG_16801 [Pyricularia oryzae 70-15]|uniref:Uncharacterized protein n=2 Tax=Pyricularia oryzae TaxID=318829 RepID=G4N1U3_PYRO7|nr:uncharacterized protein MGG_16801 [Pyricularia oryzae 70-15]EHA52458.1 hypothetical protein MGG_16801 [Pyricularia oryzae 70-15]
MDTGTVSGQYHYMYHGYLFGLQIAGKEESKPPTEQGPFWQLCSHTPTPGGIHHPKPAGRTVCITRQQPFLLFPASKQASSRDLPDPSSGVRALRHSPLLTWGHGWEGHQGPTHTKRKNPTATLWWESGLGIRSGPGFPALALAWMSMSLFLVTVPIPVPVFGQNSPQGSKYFGLIWVGVKVL